MSTDHRASGVCVVYAHPTSSPQLHMQAAAYIDAIYNSTFSITLPTPDHMFVALENTTIIGTIGVQVPDSTGRLRLPATYHLITSHITNHVQESCSVEMVRWISGTRAVSALLMLNAVRFARKNGFQHAWCEQTPAVHRASRIFGITFTKVGTHVRDSAVDTAYRTYYEHHESALYVCDLAQAEGALSQYLER